MIVTLIYLVSAILRRRKNQWYNRELCTIFEKYHKENSVMFYPLSCDCVHGYKCNVEGNLIYIYMYKQIFYVMHQYNVTFLNIIYMNILSNFIMGKVVYIIGKIHFS